MDSENKVKEIFCMAGNLYKNLADMTMGLCATPNSSTGVELVERDSDLSAESPSDEHHNVTAPLEREHEGNEAIENAENFIGKVGSQGQQSMIGISTYATLSNTINTPESKVGVKGTQEMLNENQKAFKKT